MNVPFLFVAFAGLLFVAAIFVSHRFGRIQAESLRTSVDHDINVLRELVYRGGDQHEKHVRDTGLLRTEVFGEIDRKAKQHALELQSLRESLTNRYTNVQSRVAELEHVPNEASQRANALQKRVGDLAAQIGTLKARVDAVEVNHRRLSRGELDRIKNAVIAMAAVADPAGRVEVSRAICRAVDAAGKQSPEGGSEPEAAA